MHQLLANYLTPCSTMATEEVNNSPNEEEGNIDWRRSKAKLILLEDLENGVLPIDNSIVTAEVAWQTHYIYLPEFVTVGFDQFKKRLADHRKQVGSRKKHLDKQMAGLHRDKQLHPPATHNKRGELNFWLSPAAPKLAEDVKNELHIELGVEGLFHHRAEYFDWWDFPVFKRRVKQQIARERFTYYLELHRAKKTRKELAECT